MGMDDLQAQVRLYQLVVYLCDKPSWQFRKHPKPRLRLRRAQDLGEPLAREKQEPGEREHCASETEAMANWG